MDNTGVTKLKNICQYCLNNPAKLLRSKNGFKSCLECFYFNFEEEIHKTIINENLFKENELVIIAISGGKDSTVLLHVIYTLMNRYKYPITLKLLSIDEGIVGYRDDSLESVKKNSITYDLPLEIISYSKLFGLTMDQVVEKTSVRTSCTYCGVFRRRALDVGQLKLKGDRIYTGHNADDMVETIFMNILRGDSFRLCSCTEAATGKIGDLLRCKPFKYAYEKEIVLYAHFKKLDYFSTECTYAKEAYRGHLKELIKKLIILKPGIIETIIKEASSIKLKDGVKTPNLVVCEVCKQMSSNKICKACLFVTDLNNIK